MPFHERADQINIKTQRNHIFIANQRPSHTHTARLIRAPADRERDAFARVARVRVGNRRDAAAPHRARLAAEGAAGAECREEEGREIGPVVRWPEGRSSNEVYKGMWFRQCFSNLY